MIVKKIIAFSFGFMLLVIAVSAQESTPEMKHARPDIPGTFVVELGINRVTSPAERFSTGLWGSRTLNIYYQYDMRILKSKFSFHPGIGLSFERYKFKNNHVLGYQGDVLSMQSPNDISGLNLPIRKSQLITNYLDIPLELRFSANPDDPTRSFKISVGGRFGYLIKSYTKIKYREDGDMIKQKTNRRFNLNDFRYGIYTKIGAGNFSVFGYYNLSTLFKTGSGPVFDNSDPTEMQTYTIGISLASF
jgi:hypothetical protein